MKVKGVLGRYLEAGVGPVFSFSPVGAFAGSLKEDSSSDAKDTREKE